MMPMFITSVRDCYVCFNEIMLFSDYHTTPENEKLVIHIVFDSPSIVERTFGLTEGTVRSLHSINVLFIFLLFPEEPFCKPACNYFESESVKSKA